MNRLRSRVVSELLLRRKYLVVYVALRTTRLSFVALIFLAADKTSFDNGGLDGLLYGNVGVVVSW